MSGPAGPGAPEVDADSERWWAALRDHRVVLERCAACGRVRFPPMPACPWCGTAESEEVEAAGGGTIYSWVRVHRPVGEFDGDLPFVVASVELDEGCRMFGRLEPAEAAGIGVRVGFEFFDHAEWTELRFRVPGGNGPP
ncbi:MAG TPA: OB-fold domain-containing protein [Actinomycetota bacterium]